LTPTRCNLRPREIVDEAKQRVEVNALHLLFERGFLFSGTGQASSILWRGIACLADPGSAKIISCVAASPT
jgi:hypothetical protein